MERSPSSTRALTALAALGCWAATSAQSPIEQVAADFGLLGCSVTTFCGDSIQQSVHLGTRQVEEGLPVTSSTLYRIASVSKAVVATACARLVESGTLSYSAPAGGVLGWPLVHPDFPDQPVTVGDLLSHQSGLQDGSGYGAFLGATYAAGPAAAPISDLVAPSGPAFTSDMWHAHAPGTYFQYANVNYGVLATAMEAVTGMRFDLLMDSLVLHPLGISGSFNPGTLPDPSAVATLYRNFGGWTAQADDWVSSPPVAWDYSAYVPGTNGLLFAPQGGLRIATEELARIAAVWQGGQWGDVELLDPEGVAGLQDEAWGAATSMGNTYYGLFNSWSLGLHRANQQAGDTFFGDGALFIGHPGEAYGLISDLYIEPATGWGFAFATNGAWSGYSVGTSSWYAVEEALHAAVASDRAACGAATRIAEAGGPRAVLPATFHASQPLPEALHAAKWYDVLGRDCTADRLAPSEPGHYLLRLPGGKAHHTWVVPN